MTEQQAIKYLISSGLSEEQIKTVVDAFKPKTGWIPVTEDAPPKGTICLWCNKQGSVFTSEITYQGERISYVGKHGYFHNGLENYGDIVAWRPLPEPYKEENKIEQTLAYADQDTLMPAT